MEQLSAHFHEQSNNSLMTMGWRTRSTEEDL